MRLDECGRWDVDGEKVGELAHAVGFVLPAAVGEQDEGDAQALEREEGGAGARNGVGGAEKDAIDAGGSVSDVRLRLKRRMVSTHSNAKAKSGIRGEIEEVVWRVRRLGGWRGTGESHGQQHFCRK